jgi:hypothetical protein
MRLPEDEVLLRDMLDHARKAVAATGGRTRIDLDNDSVLAAARLSSAVMPAHAGIQPSLPGGQGRGFPLSRE